MDRQAVKTYSKSRPKSFFLQDRLNDKTVFADEENDDHEYTSSNEFNMKESSGKLETGIRMKKFASSTKSQRKLKSTKKSSLKDFSKGKAPLKMVKVNKNKTTGKSKKESCNANIRKKGQNIDSNSTKKSGFEDGAVLQLDKVKIDDRDADESIERLRKDTGMTWQQKISMFLPKMDVGYQITKENPIQKANPLLDISAEVIEDEASNEDDEDDYTYTYTWVTASGTKTNGQTTDTAQKVERSKESSEATLVPVKEDVSKNESGKKSKTPMVEQTKCDFIENDKAGVTRHQQWNSTVCKNAQNIKDCGFPIDISSVRLSTGGKSKGKRSVPMEVIEQECDFIETDKAGLTMNQPWNSTVNKNAQNIKDCGFPVDISSVRLSTSAKKRTPLQQIQETTPSKENHFLVPPKPKKKKKQLCSTKMFLTDYSDFMVADISSISKGKNNDSIEIARDKSPFVRICRTDSPITPLVSPKKTNEPVFTSTPTKDKNKEKEFPEFDISSVQIPEFEDDELPVVNESRVVNSQEIVCESLEEDVPEPAVIVIDESQIHKQVDHKDNDRRVENKSKLLSKDCGGNISRSQGAKSFCLDDNEPDLNISVIPINKSLECLQNNNLGTNMETSRPRQMVLDQCPLTTISVPVKPLKVKCKPSATIKSLQQNIPLDSIQCGCTC